jgi:NitT/TauT family transport system permease protein
MSGRSTPPPSGDISPEIISDAGAPHRGPTSGSAMKRRLREFAATVGPPVITFAMIIFLWWFAVWYFEVPVYLVPSPELVLPSLVEYWPDLWENTQFTVTAVMLGFIASIVTAIPMGYAIAISRTTKQAAYPVLVFIQLIPKIAIAPLFVVWFGFALESKVMLTTLLTFFPLLLASIAGFQTLDDRVLYLTRTMGASAWQTFRYVRLPSALPVIFSGLKVSATIAVTAAIVAEFVGSNNGLGYRLLVASQYLDTPLIFAILLLMTIIGLALNYIVEVVEYFVLPWRRVRT